MLKNSESIFENVDEMLKKLKKASYEAKMKTYREDNEENLREITAYVSASENRKTAAAEVAKEIIAVADSICKKNGRLNSRKGADLDFYCIYYVFPALLLTEAEDAELIVTTLKDKWNAHYNKNIGYTTYDKLYSSFRDKILGIF